MAAADPDERPYGRLLELEYGFPPREASSRGLQELIERAVAEVDEAGGVDPEVVIVGDLRGTRLPALVERIARRIGLDSVGVPSRREQIAGAFLAATGHRSPESPAKAGVAILTDSFLGLAVGTPGCLPDWTASRPITAGSLAGRARFSDPPTGAQLEAAASAATRSLGSLVPPEPPSGILLVTEEAYQIVDACGSQLSPESVTRALHSPGGTVGRDDGGARDNTRPSRSRLAATLVICRALLDQFGMPLDPMVPDPALARELLGRPEHAFRPDGPKR